MSSADDVGGMLTRLHLKEKSAVSLEAVEEDYVLDIAVQNRQSSDRVIAATSSNHTIRLFNYSKLTGTKVIKGHESVITGVQFARTEHDLLFSSSHDKTVRCWDTRTDMGKAVQKLEGYDEANNIFTSFDINCDDMVICAGTEEGKNDEDTHIMFWDRRQGRLLGVYSDSHEDDVTQIKFHPSKRNMLGTGSTDGLVCIFDISQTSEEDAIQLTLNSESSVACIGWYGENNGNVYCVTHIDTLHVWDIDNDISTTTVTHIDTLHVWDIDNDGEDVKIITDLKDKMKATSPLDYLVDCFSAADGELHATAGTHSGDIRLLNVSGKSPVVVNTLSGGHNSTVRVSHWDNETGTLLTGGEDSFLCLWSKDATSSTKTSSKVKLKMKKSVSKKLKPY